MFARSATPAAVDELKSGVGSGGPARVVCPLDGERALYVAVAAPDEDTLRERLDAVLATRGLGDAEEYLAVSRWDGVSFPTHLAVGAHVGFALVEDGAGTDALDGLSAVGGAVAADGTLILEMTGDDEATVRRLLAAIRGAVTAVGATADGAGFRTA